MNFFFQVPANDSQSYINIYNFFLLNDIDLKKSYTKSFGKMSCQDLPDERRFNNEILKISLNKEITNRQTLKKIPVLFINFFEEEDFFRGVVSLLGWNLSFVHDAELRIRKEPHETFESRCKGILQKLHKRSKDIYDLEVDFMIIDHDIFCEIPTNDVPFDIVPDASLLRHDVLENAIDWTDCVTTAQAEEENKTIGKISEIVKNIHENKEITIGQLLLAYVDRIFPLINNLTITNARSFADLFKKKLATGPALMAAFLDPLIFSNV